jgi:ketosteroid isomerase-like protein
LDTRSSGLFGQLRQAALVGLATAALASRLRAWLTALRRSHNHQAMPIKTLILVAALAVSGVAAQAQAQARTELVRTTGETLNWFKTTEQALLDAIAVGDTRVWDRVLDEDWVITSEEGEVQGKQEFLRGLHPLPAGLKGTLTIRELTVQEYPAFAIVRFLADETEVVFGQRLANQYRVTDTFRKTDSGWKIVASQFVVVLQDPPEQPADKSRWPGLVGTYRLQPDGWTFHVVLRDGILLGGRDPQQLKALIPLTADAFVLQGSLGDWLFIVDRDGKASGVVEFRKFEPLIWSRVPDTPQKED